MRKSYTNPVLLVFSVEEKDILTSSGGLILSENKNGPYDGSNYGDLFGKK